MGKPTTTEQLEALRLQMKRALRCGLNKIIEPNLQPDVRDRVRLDIDIAAFLAVRAKKALQLDETNEHRELIAAQIKVAIAAWLEEDGLTWLGDPSDLGRTHLSCSQH